MKKKIFILVLVLILSLNTFAFAYDDLGNAKVQRDGIITPYLQYIATADLSLNCVDDVAECFVDVLGNDDVTKIVVNMTLDSATSEGLIENVMTWKNITSNSNHLRAFKTPSVTAGYSYILTVKITAYVGTSEETITNSVVYNY